MVQLLDTTTFTHSPAAGDVAPKLSEPLRRVIEVSERCCMGFRSGAEQEYAQRFVRIVGGQIVEIRT